jgi:predicted transcriptional regulator
MTKEEVLDETLKYTEKYDNEFYELINNDIEAMCAHTSFDKAKGGINDNLAFLLNLKNTITLENGYVVVGELEQEMSIDDFAVLVAETLDCHGLRYTDTDKMIRKVAVGLGDLKDSVVFIFWDTSYIESIENINETEKKILNLLLTNKTLSNKQIRESLNVTKYESITALNSLMEKAYIEKTGEGAGTKYIFKYSDDIKGYKILENINDIFMSLKREILK